MIQAQSLASCHSLQKQAVIKGHTELKVKVKVQGKRKVLQVQAGPPEQVAIRIGKTFTALLSDAERTVLGHAGICWQRATVPSMSPSWAPSSAGEAFAKLAYRLEA